MRNHTSNHKRLARALGTAAISLLAALCLAGCRTTPSRQGPPVTKPDFSGTWVFQPDRSSLEIPPPESSIFAIEHREPQWRLERTHVFDGLEDTVVIELVTDGEPTVRDVRGLEVHSRLYWEGEVLVFDSTYTRDGAEATNVVRYRLADEGRTFIAEERMESALYSHRNTWVFERQ